MTFTKLSFQLLPFAYDIGGSDDHEFFIFDRNFGSIKVADFDAVSNFNFNGDRRTITCQISSPFGNDFTFDRDFVVGRRDKQSGGGFARFSQHFEKNITSDYSRLQRIL